MTKIFLISIVLSGMFSNRTSAAEPIVAGVVSDESAGPIKAATVKLYSVKSNWGLDNAVVETVQTDGEGRYHFTKPMTFLVPNGTDYNDHYVVVASHPDHAFGWAKITASEQSDAYDLVLGKPMKQSFIVADPAGVPLAGAKVWINSAGDPQDAKAFYRKYARFPTDIALVVATTDADGRATANHLPNTQLSFMTSLKGYAPEWRSTGRPNAKEAKVKLTAAGIVRGHVVNEQGDAVKDAIVAFDADWMNSYDLVRTNADGAFECDVLTARGGSWAEDGGTGGYRVSIRHPDYCSPIRHVTLEPGQTIDNFEIRAEPGTLLHVTLKHAGNDLKIGGVRLGASVGERSLDGYTNKDGVIEWRTTSGDGSIIFISPPAGHYVVGRQDSTRVSVAGERLDVAFELASALKPLVTVRGKVLGADGAATAGAKVSVSCAERVQTPGQHGFGQETVTDEKGEFSIKGFPSETRLCAYVETRDRKLAATGDFQIDHIGGALAQPIQLQETKLVDIDLQAIGAKGVADAKMLVSPIVGGQRIWRISRTIKTDGESRMKMDGVLPGLSYHVEDADVQDNRMQRTGAASSLFQRDMTLLEE